MLGQTSLVLMNLWKRVWIGLDLDLSYPFKPYASLFAPAYVTLIRSVKIAWESSCQKNLGPEQAMVRLILIWSKGCWNHWIFSGFWPFSHTIPQHNVFYYSNLAFWIILLSTSWKLIHHSVCSYGGVRNQKWQKNESEKKIIFNVCQALNRTKTL